MTLGHKPAAPTEGDRTVAGAPDVPLAGVRVLDFGQGAAAPWCTQLLADLGAEVLKIEPPSGDWGRSLGPPFLDGEATVFLSLNRGKRSLVLDLKQAPGRRLAEALACNCDVLVENFRPGTMDRLGLGFEALRVENPKLVYCSISGFGQSGPWSGRPAVDGVIQAMSGFMSIIGSADEEPSKAGIVADMFSGTIAALGTLAAIYARSQNGVGQRVDVSLLGSMLALQTTSLTAFLNTGEAPARLGTHAPYAAPNGAFRTRDGHVQIAAYMEHKWEAFCELIGRADLIADDRFADIPTRATNQAALKREIERALAAETTMTWVARLDELGISCAPVLDYPALVGALVGQQSPDLVTIAHPGLGSFTTVGSPIQFGGNAVVAVDPPPRFHRERIDCDEIADDPDPWARAWCLCAEQPAADSATEGRR